MSPIRVALGAVQSSLLRDILARITDLEPDMELVGEVGDANLKDALVRQRADVLICDVHPDELPEVCRQLFVELSDPPVVVGLAREGREAAICIANAGPAQLMSTIRSAVLEPAERRVIELVRPSDAETVQGTAQPYASNADCLNDLLDGLDLALLAEIDSFESTIWDDGMQRLQGLAITPGEVRNLLQKPSRAAAQRQSAELRRRRLRLAEWTTRRMAASLQEPGAPPFVRLTERFGLGSFEQFCVTAALAVEINRNKYGKAYALLQDDVTRKQPSLELLLRLYDSVAEADRWDATRVLEASQPLRRWNLLRFPPRDPGEPATTFGRRVEIDDRISRFLLGSEDLGSPLEEAAVAGPWDAESLRVPPPSGTEGRLVHLVGEVMRGAPGAPPRLVLHVHGRPGTGRRSLIAAVCQRLGLRLIRADVGRLAALAPSAFEDCLVLLARESMLQPTALCLENGDQLLDDEGPSPRGIRAIAQALRTVTPVTFVVGQRPWSPEDVFQEGVFQSIPLDLPRAGEARRIWAERLGALSLDPALGGADRAAAELVSRFSLSTGQIFDAAASARTRALLQASGPLITLADLYRVCREQCSHRLGNLARHVTTSFGWDDLILPASPRSQLRELETAIRNARGVLEDWNFESRLSYGRGITALFSGPSGTGKTMAASILAQELGLDLYRIDLSQVVSKYIGETEKNLDRIFRQAEDANAMLFFDEADALFGKRSAIKDAHDRYANIEIAYLLQKMEDRLGVTILATNLRGNMDEAFLRRIRFGIEFPMPEHAQRLQIWERSLPPETRLAADVDLPMLAKRLRITGASIMNVCVGAASLAYEPGGTIGMGHFLHAAKRELQKLGQQYSESDFSPPADPAGADRPGGGA